MAAFTCKVRNCGIKFNKIADFREHNSERHGKILCTYLECDKTFSDKKALREHVESDHMGYGYACGKCGRGGYTWMSRRNYVSSHRKSHPDCQKSITLQLRPGEGIFFEGEPYEGMITGELIYWRRELFHMDMTGLTFKQMREMEEPAGPPEEEADEETIEAAKIIEAALLEQDGPVAAEPIQPTVEEETAGFICGKCPKLEGQFVTFGTCSDLILHLIGEHDDGVLLVMPKE